MALHFSVPDAHYYYPTYASSGVNENAAFTAGATGDLDCDDIRSTFVRVGSINTTGEIVGEVSGNTPATVTNELE